MTAAVTVRPARLSDADAIAALTRQLGSAAAERLSRLLTRNGQQILVADRDGRAIGWIHLVAAEYIDSGAFVIVAGLVVDREYRKQGIGRQLLTHAEEWASRNGCSVVRLSSNARRTEAHVFYQRAGYTNLKTQYSFAKPVGAAGEAALRALVPDVT